MAKAKFAICVPDYENNLIWCQHHNGNWAPPFPMGKKDPDFDSESESAAIIEK